PQRSDMKIDVYFTPLGLSAGDMNGRAVVVIDVLRATSTIVTALAAGAKAIVPAASSDEAVRLTANLERNGIVLAGERRMLKIEGFALGNSPREMTPEAVSGKTLFLATTNGTPALLAAQGGDPVLVAAALNFSAVADRARNLFQERGELVIICAGREKQFALEDAYTAGRFIKAVKKGVPPKKLGTRPRHRALAGVRIGCRDPADPRVGLGPRRVRAFRRSLVGASRGPRCRTHPAGSIWDRRRHRPRLSSRLCQLDPHRAPSRAVSRFPGERRRERRR